MVTLPPAVRILEHDLVPTTRKYCLAGYTLHRALNPIRQLRTLFEGFLPPKNSNPEFEF